MSEDNIFAVNTHFQIVIFMKCTMKILLMSALLYFLFDVNKKLKKTQYITNKYCI